MKGIPTAGSSSSQPTPSGGPPLRVTLPSLDRVAGNGVFHKFKRVGRTCVGHDHGVEEQALGTLHALNEHAYTLSLSEGERIALREFRHE